MYAICLLKVAFNTLLYTLEEEISTGQRTKKQGPLYHTYYDTSMTPVRGISIVPKQDAITEVEKNYGYFAFMLDDSKDPIDALVIYRLKNLDEKAFHNLKERLSMRRTSVSWEPNLESKSFVQFLASWRLSTLHMSTKQ